MPREDDVERCDFGATEIAELKAKIRVLERQLLFIYDHPMHAALEIQRQKEVKNGTDDTTV